MLHNCLFILEYVCLMMSGSIPSHPGMQGVYFSIIILISSTVVGAKNIEFVLIPLRSSSRFSLTVDMYLVNYVPIVVKYS